MFWIALKRFVVAAFFFDHQKGFENSEKSTTTLELSEEEKDQNFICDMLENITAGCAPK